jgi:NAD(P)-dependent dehydrogenase (short-subunit alcohol dehydrogenase family)
MKRNLDGKIALVTGASRGYGVGISEVLVQEGARIWMTARNEGQLRDEARRVGGEPVAADVTVPADWDRVFKVILQKCGRLDILINNAGAGIKVSPLAEQSDEEIFSSLAVNLTGAVLGCRRAAEAMVRQGSGTIINISSVCAVEAWPSFAVYSAAKAGLQQLTKCLYTELRPHGARATCVIPSWGATDFAKAAGIDDFDPETRSQCIQPRELGRIVADVCLLPDHLVVQQMVVWPLVQEAVPL